jgi:superfamily II DNA or RNA helicase
MPLDDESLRGLLWLVLEPLLVYNPFLSLYYNPLTTPPGPEIPRTRYYNYLHQIALYLDALPRRRVRVLIGDEVGLGKTIEAIRLIKYLISVGEAKKILIIAPRSLIRQWLHYEIRELMYAPGVVRVLSRRTIDELMRLGSDGDRLLVLLAPMDLVKRGSLDKHAKGEFKPYYEYVSSIKWDLIVIDEAHNIGFTSSRESMRTARLKPLCERAKHLILLSATPSLGTHRDMLRRISLLVPDVSSKLRQIEKSPSLRREFYEKISDLFVYRRTKELVNKLESKQVFTSLNSFLALVRLGEYRELYEELGRFTGELLQHLDTQGNALLKIIILKRALSSPHAFLKTFTRVMEKQGPPPGIRVSDRLIEGNPDALVEAVLSYNLSSIPRQLRERALALLDKFTALYQEGDPGFKALAHLLHYVATGSGELPQELHGDYIVFSEYKDTVKYLYEKLVGFFESRGFKPDQGVKQEVVEKSLKGIEERGLSPRNLGKYRGLIWDSMEILVGRGIWILVAKLSSENLDFAYLLPAVVESVDSLKPQRALKILLSTDVASEGLNLQDFNVVANYETPWSPVKREQRIGRVYRLRQSRDCSVVDFVRDARVEYEFYMKLLYKLLNILDQRLVLKPVESILELYVLRDDGGEYLAINEESVGSALVTLYEKYARYPEQRYLEEALDRAYRELLEKLREYKDIAEELSSRLSNRDRLPGAIKDYTGCDNQDEFANTINAAVEAFLGRWTRDPPRALRELYEYAFVPRGGRMPLLLVVDEPGFPGGWLGVIDLMIDRVLRYSTPVLVYGDGDNKKIYLGLDVLKWLAEKLRKGVLRVVDSGVEDLSADMERLEKVKWEIARKLNQVVEANLRRKERDLEKLLGVNIGSVGFFEPRLRPMAVRLMGVQGVREYEEFIASLPFDTRRWMEEASVNYVAGLYEAKGCRILEKNIGVEKPYDILAECPGGSGIERLFIEVKSHLGQILVAELTESETEFAEANPRNYVVCNVAGLADEEPKSWTTLCGVYADLPKTIIKATREERRARIIFKP